MIDQILCLETNMIQNMLKVFSYCKACAEFDKSNHVNIAGRAGFEFLHILEKTTVKPLESLVQPYFMQSGAQMQQSLQNSAAVQCVGKTQHYICQRNAIR